MPRLSTSKRPTQLPSTRDDLAVVKYDESGQVFTEVICPGIDTSEREGWKWKRNGNVEQYKNHCTSGTTCSSLTDMALRSCMVHLDLITTETLHGLPAAIGWRLWDSLCKARLNSVGVGLAFSAAFPNIIPSIEHQLFDPGDTIQHHLRILTSPPYVHLTQLTLDNITLPRSSLLHIGRYCSSLTALTVGPLLKVVENRTGIDDRLIRNWSLQAAVAGSDSFQNLSALVVRVQEEVTWDVFQYLSDFPSLMLYWNSCCRSEDTIPDSIIRNAGRQGWAYQNPSSSHESFAIIAPPQNTAEVIETESLQWNVVVRSLGDIAFQHAQSCPDKYPALKNPSSSPAMHLSIGRAKSQPLNMSLSGKQALWGERFSCWFRRPQTEEPDQEAQSTKRKHAQVDSKRSIKLAKRMDMSETISAFGV